MQHPDEGTIHAWIDGELSPAEVREVEAHLGACEACANLAAEARGLVAASSRILTALDAVPADVIPVAPPTGRTQPGAATPLTRRAARPWHTPFWVRTAAAILVVAGTSALFLTGKLNNVTPETAAVVLDSAVQDVAVHSAPEELRMEPAASPAAPIGSGAATRGAPAAVARPASPPAAAQEQPLSGGAQKTALAVREAPTDLARSGQPRVRAESNVPVLTDSMSVERMNAKEEMERQRAARETTTEQATNLAMRRSMPADTAAARNTAPTMSGTVSGILAGAEVSPRRRAASAPRSSAPAAMAAPEAAAAPAADAFALGRGSAPSAFTRFDASAVRAASGCFALTMSPWTRGTIPSLAPPAKIELDTLRSERGDLLVHPGRGAASNGALRAFWMPVGDSLQITWLGGDSGMRLTLPATGDVRRGVAETLGGRMSGYVPQTSNVEARRISCRE